MPIPRQTIPFPPGLLPAALEWRGSAARGSGLRAAFEREAADFLGFRSAVAVGSGREALQLLLMSLRLPAGSGVALPAFTFPAVPAAVRDLGFRPVFVDVDPATFNLDGDRLAAVLEARPDVRAAIVTHTFGVGAPMADLSDACRRRGVALVEDCAHAFRPFPAGQPRGTAAFFSLGNSKQVNALGGGLAATDDPDLLAGAAARLRHGGDGPGPLAAALAKQGAYSAVTFPAFFAVAVRPLALLAACTGRDLERRGVDAAAPVLDTAPAALHPFKAALARRQIPAAGALNERRVRLATLLDGELDPAIDRQQVPASVPPLLMFTILAPDREALAARLLWRGIDTKRDFLADCSALFDRRPMEVASRVSRRALHLPFHPDLTDDQVRRVARAVNGAWSRQ